VWLDPRLDTHGKLYRYPGFYDDVFGLKEIIATEDLYTLYAILIEGGLVGFRRVVGGFRQRYTGNQEIHPGTDEQKQNALHGFKQESWG
jgi:hypothetical protein